jgi:hypothetical protein
VAVEPHLYFLNARKLFQSLFDRLRSAHSDGAAFTFHKTINVNRDGLCSFLFIGRLWEGDCRQDEERKEHGSELYQH